MKILAKGKGDVLAHLEKAALARSGKPGAYAILGDESASAEIVIIAGHTFSGSHTLSESEIPEGIVLHVENGAVVDLD